MSIRVLVRKTNYIIYNIHTSMYARVFLDNFFMYYIIFVCPRFIPENDKSQCLSPPTRRKTSTINNNEYTRYREILCTAGEYNIFQRIMQIQVECITFEACCTTNNIIKSLKISKSTKVELVWFIWFSLFIVYFSNFKHIYKDLSNIAFNFLN